jgi:hypothetical protein
MTAAAAETLKPQPQPAAVNSVSPIVPIKIGFFGGQGAGKTTSAPRCSRSRSRGSCTEALPSG